MRDGGDGCAVERAIGELDLRRRVRPLTGADTWHTHPEPALGLAPLVFSDGPAGVRGPGWDACDTSALLPCPSALGALWDEDRVRRLGELLGDEARRKGVHVLLAPTLNLHRSPLAGRHFECFSEDPLLAARTGAALIRGIQSRGVAATAKHYVANDSETQRLTLDVRVDERVLREVYLAPFEAAVRAGVWVVMSAYNKVNGTTMSESSLLAEPLKGEWGFDGVVVSDWGAVRSTAAAALSAQDLAMPGPGGPWGEALAEAVERGEVPAGAVTEKLRRLLRLATRVHALPAPARPEAVAPAPGARAGAALPSGAAAEAGAAAAAPAACAPQAVAPTALPLPYGDLAGAAAAGLAPAGGGPAGVGPAPAAPAEAALEDGAPVGGATGGVPRAGSAAAGVALVPGDPVAVGLPSGISAGAALAGLAPAGGGPAVAGPAPASPAEAALEDGAPVGMNLSARDPAGVASAGGGPGGGAPAGGGAGAPGGGASGRGVSGEATGTAAGDEGAGVCRVLREGAAASFVLLENRGVLPLDPGSLRRVAVIGRHAVAPRVQGGGSSEVFPHRTVTPLAGLRAALPGRVRIAYEPGPQPAADPEPVGPRHARDPVTGAPGVRLRVLDADGAELATRAQPSGRVLEPELPPGAATVELTTLLHPDATGPWTLGLGGFGPLRLTVDAAPVLEGEFPPGTDDPAVIHVRPPLHTARVHLTAGRPVRVVARRGLAPGTGRATVLAAAPPAAGPTLASAAALEAARGADAVVVVVGTDEGGESEGRDRDTLRLDPGYGRFIGEIARANPRTVVVVNCGGPVELPWRADPGAVLLTWFPGQEGGAALADVLLGRAEPGGRLPTTWPAALADAPVRTTRPRRGVLPYEEGLHVGYRGWLRSGAAPAYWLGHGLGYTTWEFEGIGRPEPVPGGYEVPVRLRNTGGRRGREVVQVHLARPGSAVERPARWLAGWAAVEADPGAAVTARVRIPLRALEHWSARTRGWELEPGRFTLLAGRTAGDLPLRSVLDAGAPHGS
ncbi:glycoside hydrolase family 3 C-terminal domain-containing protein [Streptomyces sp. NPDC002033]|uniref:glycoside hydrolase family 3 C-terminal domain-containing protein n=1 Tax=unclassified Streptomyces TaxID=2593676 RepID=UPI00332FC718